MAEMQEKKRPAPRAEKPVDEGDDDPIEPRTPPRKAQSSSDSEEGVCVINAACLAP